jgi:hypothetical protein
MVLTLLQLSALVSFMHFHFAEGTVYLRVLKVLLRGFVSFVESLSQEFMLPYIRLFLLKLQQYVIIVRSELPRLKFFHDSLVVTILLGCVVSDSRLPVAIWRTSEHELVVSMIFGLKTEFTDLCICAHNTLILCIIDDTPFAALALERSIILRRLFSCSTLYSLYLLVLVNYLSL